MDEIINVYCLNQFDPPYVVVEIAGQIPFQVSWGVYTYLQQNFGFPPLICGDYEAGGE